MEISFEERRVAIEAIATLANVKSVMAELILKRAGIPPEIYGPLLHRHDETTGRALSKRQIAPLILEAAEARADCSNAVRRIVEIAADWKSFHLAHNEYEARATVGKAREILGTMELIEAQEA